MLVPVNSVSLHFSGWVISMLYPNVPKLVRLDSDFGGPWSLMWSRWSTSLTCEHITDEGTSLYVSCKQPSSLLAVWWGLKLLSYPELSLHKTSSVVRKRDPEKITKKQHSYFRMLQRNTDYRFICPTWQTTLFLTRIYQQSEALQAYVHAHVHTPALTQFKPNCFFQGKWDNNVNVYSTS